MRKLIFFILLAGIINTFSPGNSYGITDEINSKYKLGLEVEISSSWNLGPDFRMWRDQNGIEIYYGIGLGYCLARIKYLRKLESNCYIGIGLGQSHRESVSFYVVTSSYDYSEDLIYLSYGSEPSDINGKYMIGMEIGYILSSVKSSTGNQSYRPQSRLYLSLSVRI